MKNLLLYASQVIVVSGILYGYYYFFLRNRYFHQYNRFYLLFASVAGLLIPLVRIPFSYSSAEASKVQAVRLLEIIYSTETAASGSASSYIQPAAFNWWIAGIAAYSLIAAILLISSIIGLMKIRRMAGFYRSEKWENIHFVSTDAPGTPFSFFNWLFWDEKIPLQSAKGRQMLRHELFHIRQKHSWDIMFMQLLVICCWINPFVYLIRKELRVIHEFLADEYASEESGGQAYAELLVMHVLRSKQTFVNPFFQTQIKRRIAMITNTKPNARRYARKLLVLPFAAILLGLVAFRLQPKHSHTGEDALTVIVDAGHGGFDPGAKSPDSKYIEADMTLELANLMRSLAPEYGINVVLTRETSDAVGATKKEDLQNRVEKTRSVKPAAFLSLHVNVTGKPGEYQERRSGFEVMISEKPEDQQTKIIASAMLEKLSGVYTTLMQIKQRPQQNGGIYVLDKSACPSLLVECGFINNPKDIEFFNDKSNKEKTVRAMLSVLRGQLKK